LRFLWTLGNFGKHENETHLVVDAETFLNNCGKEKKVAILSFVQESVFKVLFEFGVCSGLVESEGLRKADLTTGTGYLRRKGWVMKMSFEPKLGRKAALKVLQNYVKKLNKKYGSRVFQRFRNADITVLLQT
jgi:hypothetical protein